MHRTKALAVLVPALALSLTLAACSGTTAEPFAPEDSRYRFDVRVAQAGDPEAAVRGEARVTDLETDRVLAAPGFLMEWGQSATVTSDDPETGARFELEVEVAEDGRSATYRATVLRADRLIASRRATVPVDPAAGGIGSPGS